METGGVHGNIERGKMPPMAILTPWDWQQFVFQRCRKYTVQNMELDDVKVFKLLYCSKNSPLLYRKVDSRNEPVAYAY